MTSSGCDTRNLGVKGFSAQDTFFAQVRADARSQPYPLTDEIFALGADGMHVATTEELG